MMNLIALAFFLAFVTLLGLTIHEAMHTAGWFNPASFCGGFSTLIAASGMVHIGHGRWGSSPQPPPGS